MLFFYQKRSDSYGEFFVTKASLKFIIRGDINGERVNCSLSINYTISKISHSLQFHSKDTAILI